MRAAASVQILATSRESLRDQGNHLYRLLPRATPPVSSHVTATESLNFPAVRPFAGVLDEFDLSDLDVPLVAVMSQKLDGIPLAIIGATASG